MKTTRAHRGGRAGGARRRGAAPRRGSNVRGADDDTRSADGRGHGASPDIAKAGNVTLPVWDQEVRGGQNAEINALNKAFQAKYPNIKIKRVAKSFTDLQKTLKLAVVRAQPARRGRGQPGLLGRWGRS